MKMPACWCYLLGGRRSQGQHFHVIRQQCPLPDAAQLTRVEAHEIFKTTDSQDFLFERGDYTQSGSTFASMYQWRASSLFFTNRYCQNLRGYISCCYYYKTDGGWGGGGGARGDLIAIMLQNTSGARSEY